MTEPIFLRPVPPEEKARLGALLQASLAELAPFYGERPDDRGLFPYPYFEDYFSDPTRRAYFLMQEGAAAGFALLNRHSPLGREIDWAMAEFYIAPSHRRRHLGRQAARLLFQCHPGRWELKFSRENIAARYFWLSVTQDFLPERLCRPDHEIVLSFIVP